jgi:16S rRNA C967 or C1407 C5-methylase (RsmB/RsmF family)
VADGKFRGLVNGVLRNFLRRQSELTAAAAADTLAAAQHPDWWLAQLQAAYPTTGSVSSPPATSRRRWACGSMSAGDARRLFCAPAQRRNRRERSASAGWR